MVDLIELIKDIIRSSLNKCEFKYKNIANLSPFICSVIGFMIYLEIIELNFCKLNYNLRKYINERSIKDTYENDTTESIISESEIGERTLSINDYVEMPINKKHN